MEKCDYIVHNKLPNMLTKTFPNAAKKNKTFPNREIWLVYKYSIKMRKRTLTNMWWSIGHTVSLSEVNYSSTSSPSHHLPISINHLSIYSIYFYLLLINKYILIMFRHKNKNIFLGIRASIGSVLILFDTYVYQIIYSLDDLFYTQN